MRTDEAGRRPGFGIRHPDLIALLQRHSPVATVNDVWANGTLPLRVSAYVGVPPIAALVSSIRCVVRVGEKFVVCRVPGELHVLPGGRPEPGETPPETAVREVYEETGWHLDPESLVPLGFLHLERLVDAPPDHPYPHRTSCRRSTPVSRAPGRWGRARTGPTSTDGSSARSSPTPRRSSS